METSALLSLVSETVGYLDSAEEVAAIEADQIGRASAHLSRQWAAVSASLGLTASS